MDLGTIKTRIKNGFYANAQLAIDDFELTFENCFKFNRPQDDVFMMGQSVLEFFRASISKMPQDEKISNKYAQMPGKKKRKDKNKNTWDYGLYYKKKPRNPRITKFFSENEVIPGAAGAVKVHVSASPHTPQLTPPPP